MRVLWQLQLVLLLLLLLLVLLKSGEKIQLRQPSAKEIERYLWHWPLFQCCGRPGFYITLPLCGWHHSFTGVLIDPPILGACDVVYVFCFLLLAGMLLGYVWEVQDHAPVWISVLL